MDYNVLSDEELVDYIRRGDQLAETFLFQKYTKIVAAETRGLYLQGGEWEDLFQEGMIGLIQAVNQYRSGHGAGFLTFATRCIRCDLLTAVTRAKSQKNRVLNEALPIEVSQSNGEEGRTTGEWTGLEKERPSTPTPEDEVVMKENIQELNHRISKRLSTYEQQILELYLEGLSYQDIAEKMNKNKKSIDNGIQRIRAKLAD